MRWGLVALVAVQLVGLNAWAWQQRQALARQKASVTALLQGSFPHVRAVIDAPAQMGKELERLRTAAGRPGDTDLEPMLRAADAAWPPSRGPAESIRFEPGRLTLASPVCLPLVQALLASDVPLLAVSDMVLPGARIEALLRAAGYPALTVLSSADEGVSKRVQGRLFGRALQRLGLPAAAVLHVGDDGHADVAMARRRGLASVQVQPPRERLLALHPALARERLPVQASLFWGEVAIELHRRAALPTVDDTTLKARLASLLQTPGLLQRRPQAFVAAWFQEAA